MLQYPSHFVCIGLNYVEGIAFRRFKLFEISSLLINSDFLPLHRVALTHKNLSPQTQNNSWHSSEGMQRLID